VKFPGRKDKLVFPQKDDRILITTDSDEQFAALVLEVQAHSSKYIGFDQPGRVDSLKIMLDGETEPMYIDLLRTNWFGDRSIGSSPEDKFPVYLDPEDQTPRWRWGGLEVKVEVKEA
jgi:hypothetical protein